MTVDWSVPVYIFIHHAHVIVMPDVGLAQAGWSLLH
jgi:hypothetical protein